MDIYNNNKNNVKMAYMYLSERKYNIIIWKYKKREKEKYQ